MYRTAEANYRQTRSIARPVCDSRATCIRSTCVCSCVCLINLLLFLQRIKFLYLYEPYTDNAQSTHRRQEPATISSRSNSVCPSVRLSVCLLRSGIRWKRLNILS